LLYGRTNDVLWKTSGFLKRRIKNAEVLLWVWDMIKHGVHVTVHGLSELYSDGKWVIGVKKERFSSKYGEVSYKKMQKTQRVRKDYIKFIPFSFFIILPGGEALLPAWLLVFPNSIPS
jgi:hypothetical protein